MRDLTPSVVRSRLSGLGDAHPTRNAHAHGLLNMVCNAAVRDGLIERNTCMIERAMNPKPNARLSIPTIPELEAIAGKLVSDTKTPVPRPATAFARVRLALRRSVTAAKERLRRRLHDRHGRACGNASAFRRQVALSDYSTDRAVARVTNHPGVPRGGGRGWRAIPPEVSATGRSTRRVRRPRCGRAEKPRVW